MNFLLSKYKSRVIDEKYYTFKICRYRQIAKGKHEKSILLTFYTFGKKIPIPKIKFKNNDLVNFLKIQKQ